VCTKTLFKTVVSSPFGDAPLYYDAPDYLNVFVAAVPSPLTELDGHIRTMFCCWVVNQECVTLITDQSY